MSLTFLKIRKYAGIFCFQYLSLCILFLFKDKSNLKEVLFYVKKVTTAGAKYVKGPITNTMISRTLIVKNFFSISQLQCRQVISIGRVYTEIIILLNQHFHIFSVVKLFQRYILYKYMYNAVCIHAKFFIMYFQLQILINGNIHLPNKLL